MDKDKVADELYNIKEQLSNGSYLYIMNLLAGKKEQIDIDNAKFVQITCDEFDSEIDMEDDDYENLDSHVYINECTKIFEITDNNEHGCCNHRLYDKHTTRTSMSYLKKIVEHYNNDSYLMHCSGQSLRIISIKILQTK